MISMVLFRCTDNMHTSIMAKAEAAETNGDENSAKFYKAGKSIPFHDTRMYIYQLSALALMCHHHSYLSYSLSDHFPPMSWWRHHWYWFTLCLLCRLQAFSILDHNDPPR